MSTDVESRLLAMLREDFAKEENGKLTKAVIRLRKRKLERAIADKTATDDYIDYETAMLSIMTIVAYEVWG